MTAAAPEISVVVPTHGGRFLAATVASVRAQTLPDWELVIVDDGSRDGTADVAAGLAAADARIRVVTHAHSRGIAAARNTGLVATTRTSRYVAFLDHDDLWTPDTLAVLRAALHARHDQRQRRVWHRRLHRRRREHGPAARRRARAGDARRRRRRAHRGVDRRSTD